MECSSYFHCVAIGVVDAILPITEITRSWIKVTRLHIFIICIFSNDITMINQLFMVWSLTTVVAMTPRIEYKFRVGMPSQSGFEFTCTISRVIVHFCKVLNESGFWFRVASSPILIHSTIIIVVFAINIVFIYHAVAIVISCVKRSCVYVIIGNTSPFIFRWSACSWNEWDGSS